MGIRKANLQRLASLSALGAGAMAVSGPSMEASTIVFSGPVDGETGNCPSCAADLAFAGPYGLPMSFHLQHGTQINGVRLWVVIVDGKPGPFGTSFQVPGSVTHAGALSALPANAHWGNRHPRGGAPIALLSSATTYPVYGKLNTFNAVDRYLLFRFIGGNLTHDIYGWAQLNVSFQMPKPSQPGYVDVDLVDYAYDTSGKQIPAGDTGVPEPSTLVLTGLAALALGAKGLRAWRSARGAEARPAGTI